LLEFAHIYNKLVNVDNELLLELGLVLVKIITNDECLLNKTVPLLDEILLLIKFVSIHDIRQLVLNQVVHLSNWFELEVNVGLLCTNLLQCIHDTAKRVNLIGAHSFVNLETDLLDLVGKVSKQGFSLSMDLLGVDHLPVVDILRQRILDSLSLE
jgi:hypothetical protein